FQKLQRDHAIASIFEGTTHVNLANVAGQLPYRSEPPEATGGEEELLADLFCWTRTPPTWEPDGRRLQLTNEGRDEVGQRFEEISEELLAAANAHAAPGVAAELKDLLSSIGGLGAKVDEGIRANEGDTGSVAALARAKRYCELHAMMSCVLTWLHNRHAFGGAFADGRWLVLCLQRLLQRAHPDTVLSEEFLPSLEDAMFRCSDERRWFSQGRRRDAARRGGVPGQGPCGPRGRAARAERRPDRAAHRAADDERQDAAPARPARVPRPGARCAIRFSLRSNVPSDAIATVWAVRGCCGSGQGFL